jgi:hypothetical protein
MREPTMHSRPRSAVVTNAMPTSRVPPVKQGRSGARKAGDHPNCGRRLCDHTRLIDCLYRGVRRVNSSVSLTKFY